MPSSTHAFLSRVADRFVRVRPESILDIGVGFGKWGYLAREYGEVFAGRVYPDQWTMRLVGVEAWQRYVDGLPWLRALYDEIIVGDIGDTAVRARLGTFQITMAGDVIEHLEKPAALEVLCDLLGRTTGELILSLPLGESWLGNRIVDGNQFEKHRSAWAKSDIEAIGNVRGYHVARGVRGDIGLLFVEGQA